jgi:hypothetical protein
MLLKIFKESITYFTKSSNPIFNVYYILKYLHVDIYRRDLVHNNHDIAIYTSYYKYVEHAMAQLVEALRYKPEGHGFDSRLCNWNFSLT